MIFAFQARALAVEISKTTGVSPVSDLPVFCTSFAIAVLKEETSTGSDASTASSTAIAPSISLCRRSSLIYAFLVSRLRAYFSLMPSNSSINSLAASRFSIRQLVRSIPSFRANMPLPLSLPAFLVSSTRSSLICNISLQTVGSIVKKRWPASSSSTDEAFATENLIPSLFLASTISLKTDPKSPFTAHDLSISVKTSSFGSTFSTSISCSRVSTSPMLAPAFLIALMS
mmetsp:Transcript_6751/g.20461  ORF Transcript_6751/g.20461 Transcript_6751/m.20461 type:complete len:229 (-) Transcript_6751:495-1181(-)